MLVLQKHFEYGISPCLRLLWLKRKHLIMRVFLDKIVIVFVAITRSLIRVLIDNYLISIVIDRILLLKLLLQLKQILLLLNWGHLLEITVINAQFSVSSSV